ncbi:unnamed protein product, partial [Musa textilis]
HVALVCGIALAWPSHEGHLLRILYRDGSWASYLFVHIAEFVKFKYKYYKIHINHILYNYKLHVSLSCLCFNFYKNGMSVLCHVRVPCPSCSLGKNTNQWMILT